MALYTGAPLQTTQTNLLSAVRDSQNREAWGDFYQLYAPMLRQFTRRLGLSENDIDDVSQEVLMIAHRSLREGIYDPAKGGFRRWLYGITRRQALAALRARRRRTRVQHITPDNGVDLMNQLEDRKEEATLQEIWKQEWRYALLDQAIEYVRPDLGEKTFRAFTLYAIQGLPVPKVAEQLNIAPASVYVYKSRVLDAIRHWVKQFEAP